MTTKAEAKHLDRLSRMGCIVCRRQLMTDDLPRAEIHHPRFLAGGSQKASHWDAIPLCPIHHRTGGYRTALHAGQEAWEAKFGTERELLAAVRGLLGIEQKQGDVA